MTGPSVIGYNIKRFPVIRFFTPSLVVPDTSELPCQMNYFERKTRKMYLQAVAYLALCLQSAAETWFSLLANKTTLKETRHLTSVSACDRSDISEKGPRTQFEALTHNYTQTRLEMPVMDFAIHQVHWQATDKYCWQRAFIKWALCNMGARMYLIHNST